jgi:hypothetical protein
VRYLKDELARVKRSKATTGGGNYTNFGFYGANNSSQQQQDNNDHRGSMSRLIRNSFSSMLQPAAAPGTATASMRGSSITNASQSKPSDVSSGQESSSRGVTNLPNGERMPTKRRTTNDIESGGDDSESQHNPIIRRSEAIPMPEGRGPLLQAAAFDRSLSYLTESPAQPLPPAGIRARYGGGGGGGTSQWRDRYVMQFSGWSSAQPDAGLPPAQRAPAAFSPITNREIGSLSHSPVPSSPGGLDSTLLRPSVNQIQNNRQQQQPSNPPSQVMLPAPVGPAAGTLSGDVSGDEYSASPSVDYNPMFTMDEEKKEGQR